MNARRPNTFVCNLRWDKYALACAAGAAVGLTAQATVDGDTTDVRVGTLLEGASIGGDFFGPYGFDFSGASFSFFQGYVPYSGGIFELRARGALTFVGTGASSAQGYPSNLVYGQNVSTAGPFGVPYRGYMANFSGFSNSQFLMAGTAYLGFRFDVGNGTQYGFAQLDMFGAPDNRANFIGYAWADPGEAISTFAIDVPEPNALGVLALGALGLASWRRKKHLQLPT